MKRVMLLAAMLAMVLWAAAPALAQDAVADDEGTATGGDVDNSVDVQYVDCSQVQQAANAQYGDATGGSGDATADDDSTAAVDNSAELAAELGITQEQVNACLGEINMGAGAAGATATASAAHTASAVHTASASASASASAASVPAATAAASAAPASAAAVLPDTGGASLFALGAGALLVAGGLLARRIVR